MVSFEEKSFEENVISIKNEFGEHLITCIENISYSGQKFAVFVTKKLMYTMSVLVDEDFRGLYTPRGKQRWIIYKKYFTKKGALKAAEKQENRFVKGLYRGFRGSDGYKLKVKPIIIKLPSEWSENPDKYLNRSDALQSNFAMFANHEGIYYGNNQVIHVSAHGDGKKAACVRIGKLVPDFVDHPTDDIRLKLFRIQYRSDYEIMFDAQKFVSQKYGYREYNLLAKNCQHFTYLCTHGYPRSDDVKKAERIIDRISEVAKAFCKSFKRWF